MDFLSYPVPLWIVFLLVIAGACMGALIVAALRMAGDEDTGIQERHDFQMTDYASSDRPTFTVVIGGRG
jgi:hypothetical protein